MHLAKATKALCRWPTFRLVAGKILHLFAESTSLQPISCFISSRSSFGSDEFKAIVRKKPLLLMRVLQVYLIVMLLMIAAAAADVCGAGRLQRAAQRL
jgi:hypothetical protein